MFTRKKGKYTFSDKRHPVRGILAVIFGAASAAAFLALSILSGIEEGHGALILGAVGMAAFMLSLIGFVLALKSIREKDIFYRFPVAGIILNGIFVLLYFVLYIIGII